MKVDVYFDAYIKLLKALTSTEPEPTKIPLIIKSFENFGSAFNDITGSLKNFQNPEANNLFLQDPKNVDFIETDALLSADFLNDKIALAKLLDDKQRTKILADNIFTIVDGARRMTIYIEQAKLSP